MKKDIEEECEHIDAQGRKALGVDPEFKRMPVQYGWWLDRRRKTGYRG